MKIRQFEIRLDNPAGVFEPGKSLSGFVHLNLAKSLKLRSIKLYFVGEGKTHWDKKQGRSTVKFRGREDYLHHCLTLVAAGAHEGSFEHPEGDHAYPFSIVLQSSVPSSFESSGGYVRYFCKATIDRPWKSNCHVKKVFTVIHHLDLNAYPIADPYYFEKSQTIEGFCCSEGNVDVSFELNKTGFVPGEPIAYKIKINNHSDTPIMSATILLNQVCTYYGAADSIFSSGNLKPKEFTFPFTLREARLFIKSSKSGELDAASIVPCLPPSKLEGCKIIDIKYVVLVIIPCGSVRIKLTKEVLIGTIPLAQPVVYPTAPALEDDGTPTLKPPTYEEALAPPPSYEDSVFGTTQVRDENDDANTDGDVMWAPSYPYYDWSRHFNIQFGGEPPSQAQLAPSSVDVEAHDTGQDNTQL